MRHVALQLITAVMISHLSITAVKSHCFVTLHKQNTFQLNKIRVNWEHNETMHICKSRINEKHDNNAMLH